MSRKNGRKNNHALLLDLDPFIVEKISEETYAVEKSDTLSPIIQQVASMFQRGSDDDNIHNYLTLLGLSEENCYLVFTAGKMLAGDRFDATMTKENVK